MRARPRRSDRWMLRLKTKCGQACTVAVGLCRFRGGMMNAAAELMVTQPDAMGRHIKRKQTLLIQIDEGDGFRE